MIPERHSHQNIEVWITEDLDRLPFAGGVTVDLVKALVPPECPHLPATNQLPCAPQLGTATSCYPHWHLHAGDVDTTSSCQCRVEGHIEGHEGVEGHEFWLVMCTSQNSIKYPHMNWTAYSNFHLTHWFQRSTHWPLMQWISQHKWFWSWLLAIDITIQFWSWLLKIDITIQFWSWC